MRRVFYGCRGGLLFDEGYGIVPSLLLIEMPASLVGVNTLVPNRLVADAVRHNMPSELAGYCQVQREVRVDAHTRLDLKLVAPGRRDCYVEIKNCTLVENHEAMFPDAPTTRGQKHLQALEALKVQGHRAVLFLSFNGPTPPAFARLTPSILNTESCCAGRQKKGWRSLSTMWRWI
jgi:sugar fermentation stimulation protein